ncbi:MAG: HdeD family acid-resistance protein [Spirochaetia bacterium]
MKSFNSGISGQVFRNTFYQPWWIILLRGVVILALGVLATFWPSQTFIVLVQILGVYFLLDGLFILFMSVGNRKHDVRWKGTLIRGLITFIIGAVVVFLPTFTAAALGVVLVYLLAALSLFAGAMEIIKAVRARKEIKDEWSIVLSGIFFILLAILLFIAPLSFGIAFIRIIGILAAVTGIGFLIFAFKVQKVSRG